MTAFLVTGCAGFIGSHLCERLVEAGEMVIGVDSFDPFYPRAIKERNLGGLRSADRFELIEGDIREIEFPLTAETVVIHLAAKAGVRPSIERPVEYASVNYEGTVRLLEMAQQAGLSRFVFGSSSSVYGDTTPAPYREDAVAAEPISPYGATKRAGELACYTYSHLYGMRILALRFFTVYGPRQRPDLAIHKFTRLLADGEAVPRFGDGSAERDYTYIEDIVDGIMRGVDWTAGSDPAYDAVNLGGGTPVRLDELIAGLGRRLGVTPTIERLDDQPGDVRRTEADPSKAVRVLGYRAGTNIEEGLDRFVAWFNEEHGR